MPVATLQDRTVLSVSGVDARAFLQNLVTCDVEALRPAQAAFGALLSPQGKILFDFFIICVADDAFLIDTASDQAAALLKRLAMYKLRAKVVLASTDTRVVAVWGGDTVPGGNVVADPRADDMGLRVYADMTVGDATPEAYDAHRIALGVPQAGADFAWGDVFPHDANMDTLHGVSFTKGCYVGQEVVSRMAHRGTNRRRVVQAFFAGATPARGADIRAGEIHLGTFGSAIGMQGLAMVRTDRLADATAAGLSAEAGGTPLELVVPQ